VKGEREGVREKTVSKILLRSLSPRRSLRPSIVPEWISCRLSHAPKSGLR